MACPLFSQVFPQRTSVVYVRPVSITFQGLLSGFSFRRGWSVICGASVPFYWEIRGMSLAELLLRIFVGVASFYARSTSYTSKTRVHRAAFVTLVFTSSSSSCLSGSCATTCVRSRSTSVFNADLDTDGVVLMDAFLSCAAGCRVRFWRHLW